MNDTTYQSNMSDRLANSCDDWTQCLVVDLSRGLSILLFAQVLRELSLVRLLEVRVLSFFVTDELLRLLGDDVQYFHYVVPFCIVCRNIFCIHI